MIYVIIRQRESHPDEKVTRGGHNICPGSGGGCDREASTGTDGAPCEAQLGLFRHGCSPPESW